MNKDKIASLAREYAEEIHADSMQFFPRPLPNSMEVLVKKDQDEAERLIRFLLRRFCLVEKSKLTEEYKSATANFNNASDPVIPTMDYYLGIMKFIEYLFPEIGKEVEK